MHALIISLIFPLLIWGPSFPDLIVSLSSLVFLVYVLRHRVFYYFDKKGAEIRKDKVGNILFIFPKKNIFNKELVEKYYNMVSGEKAKKADIRPKEVDEFTLKFPVSDGPTLKKILTNAGLESGDDYKLSKQEVVDENLYKLVREEILKYYKK